MNNETIQKQAAMLVRLRELVQKYEQEIVDIKNEHLLISNQNKTLELMIESMRQERIKLLEELEDLKNVA